MALFVEYPEVGNDIADGCVTVHVAAALREQMRVPDTCEAIAELLRHLDYNKVTLKAVEENGVGLDVDEDERCVFINIGRDVLESEHLEAYMAFLPNHIDYMMQESSSDDDSEHVNAPVP